MEALTRDFISNEQRDYKFKIGHTVASALTGFVFGVIATGIIWYVFAVASVE